MSIIIWIIIVAAVASGIYYVYSAFLKRKVSSKKVSVEPGPKPSPITVTKVVIGGFSFQPRELSIVRGSAVRWINNDATAHVIVDDAGAFKSDSLPQGGTFEVVFDSSGEFSYHCAIHPSMTGKIVVE
ncbi:MAG: plastocyanin/azurin family copper-binding protein [Patescibacteria group bacterium]|nr:plastocyanin/azurin family copper-binding protein [Patescibacteria group bacterium]MCL5261826.1 plastocyanin/azurin family copper-binding protein [Patescibacteria group bacterium]